VTSDPVRRVRAEDWALVREVRLAGLADAPESFASTYADEARLPDEAWKTRAKACAEGGPAAAFTALDDGIACGLAIGIPLANEPATVELNGLWVAPSARRKGTARALVEAVCGWARERRAERVALEVTESSTAAIALYRALGFSDVAAAVCGDRRAAARRMEKRL
jgi:ribosomal protein S18 acetylase RimI-like enzyme